MGRAAVLMGLLSYSFVTVTLVADLGLPWNFWQLGSAGARAVGDVRGVVVRRSVRHDPALRVPPGSAGALGPGHGPWTSGAAGRARTSSCAVAAFVYLLSRNLALTAAAAVVFSVPGLGLPAPGQGVRAGHAGHRGRDPLHHAPELAGLAVPADAGQAGGPVVVAGPAGLVLPVLDRLRDGAGDPGRDVDRQGLAPDTPDRPAGLAGQHHLLVAAGLSRLAPRRHGAARAARRRVRRADWARCSWWRSFWAAWCLWPCWRVLLNEPGRPS